MKKSRRILAMAGVVLLLGLYLITLILACLGKDFFPMFMASLFSTLAIPVLIWLYGMVYRWLKRDSSPESDL
ncbi:MAG: hypothetical protein HFH39_10150 [Lachnospiraceae bacterium]|jgi:hypothetical protein|nr:hypothetical protein [Lachnospiraceae bacterium]MCI9645584.1 hypothetical protein [Lachnospiraceae bacterium]